MLLDKDKQSASTDNKKYLISRDINVKKDVFSAQINLYKFKNIPYDFYLYYSKLTIIKEENKNVPK